MGLMHRLELHQEHRAHQNNPEYSAWQWALYGVRCRVRKNKMEPQLRLVQHNRVKAIYDTVNCLSYQSVWGRPLLEASGSNSQRH